MSFAYGRCQFDGPYKKIEDLVNLPGIYVILSIKNDKLKVLNVGYTKHIRKTVEEETFASFSNYRQKNQLYYGCNYNTTKQPADLKKMAKELQHHLSKNQTKEVRE